MRTYGTMIITAAAVILSLLFPRQVPGGTARSYVKSIVIDGVERKYALHIPGTPAGRDRTSLVIVLHGAFGYGGIMTDYTGINDRAERSDFIAAYPESLAPIGTTAGSTPAPSPIGKISMMCVLFPD